MWFLYFCLLPVLWGVIVIVGTYKRWSFFVESFTMEALTKRHGREYAIMYSYLIGVVMIVISVFALVLFFTVQNKTLAI